MAQLNQTVAGPAIGHKVYPNAGAGVEDGLLIVAWRRGLLPTDGAIQIGCHLDGGSVMSM